MRENITHAFLWLLRGETATNGNGTDIFVWGFNNCNSITPSRVRMFPLPHRSPQLLDCWAEGVGGDVHRSAPSNWP